MVPYTDMQDQNHTPKPYISVNGRRFYIPGTPVDVPEAAWERIERQAEGPRNTWYYDALLAQRARADRRLEARYYDSLKTRVGRVAGPFRENRASRRAKATHARRAQRFADRECAAYMAREARVMRTQARMLKLAGEQLASLLFESMRKHV